MKKNAIYIISLLLAIVLIITPAAASLYSPMKHSTLKISAPRTYLSGFDVRDSTTFHPFQLQIQKMNLTPAPIPQMSLNSSDGKYYYNWGSERFTPGGHWIQ